MSQERLLVPHHPWAIGDRERGHLAFCAFYGQFRGIFREIYIVPISNGRKLVTNIYHEHLSASIDRLCRPRHRRHGGQ